MHIDMIFFICRPPFFSLSQDRPDQQRQQRHICQGENDNEPFKFFHALVPRIKFKNGSFGILTREPRTMTGKPKALGS
jgi:hypothetical protein